jgi:post-segregation antitoxin (ccd killing protein)
MLVLTAAAPAVTRLSPSGGGPLRRSPGASAPTALHIQILVYAKFIYIDLYLSVSTTVISVRIRKELKRKARELGIDVREVVEKALEEAIRRREEEELIKTLEELRSLFSRISEKEWVDAVRKSRNER